MVNVSKIYEWFILYIYLYFEFQVVDVYKEIFCMLIRD